MDPFVSLDWYSAHREAVVLVDIRFRLDGRPGRPAFEAGHLPGAVYLELEQALTEPHDDHAPAGRHPLPSPERFAAGLGAIGVGDAEPVVAYDDAGGVVAARLVWLLRSIGHEAAVLDGGLDAWPAAELERGPAPEPRPRPFTPRPWPHDRLADIDQTAAAALDGSAVVIDARSRERFVGGGPDPVDPRSGHIPGARSVPTRAHLGPDSRIAGPEALRATFAAAGVTPGTAVISYCGSGVTACHNLLALERAGLGPGRLFPGSWSQWSRDPTRAVATGTDAAPADRDAEQLG